MTCPQTCYKKGLAEPRETTDLIKEGIMTSRLTCEYGQRVNMETTDLIKEGIMTLPARPATCQRTPQKETTDLIKEGIMTSSVSSLLAVKWIIETTDLIKEGIMTATRGEL